MKRFFSHLHYRNLTWLLLSLLVIVLDQLTKVAVLQRFALGESWPVFPSFNLTLAFNKGAAFSFLGHSGAWANWFFVIIAISLSLLLLYWIIQTEPQAKVNLASFGLIIGGACSNLLDRLHYGYVIDFLHFYYQNYSWPIFNIADSAICIGAALLIGISFKKT